MRTLAFVLPLVLAAAPASADIVIGQSAPLTGAHAELGNDIRNGALAYFKRVNDAGGLPQGRLKLVTLDDRNEASLAAENTRKLVADPGVVALFGYASSPLSMAAMPAVAAHKVPFFAPFTGADIIRKQNDYVYTVRSSHADEVEKIVGFYTTAGFTRVTVLHYDDAAGKQDFGTVAAVLEKSGRKPVSVAIQRDAEVTDASVQQVIGSEPHVLMVATLHAPAAKMVKKLKAANKRYVVSSLSFAGASQLARALGEDAIGVSMAVSVPTARSNPAPVLRECHGAWTAAGHKEPMSVTALEACIAAKVLVEGMKRSGPEVSRAALHRSLTGLGRYDTGGYVVDFKPNSRHGSTYVSMVLLRPDGQVRE